MTSSGHGELEVVALSPREWRVCDGTIEESDARRILGYIERGEEGYEVLALDPAPSVCGCFSSWQESLTALERHARHESSGAAEGSAK